MHNNNVGSRLLCNGFGCKFQELQLKHQALDALREMSVMLEEQVRLRDNIGKKVTTTSDGQKYVIRVISSYAFSLFSDGMRCRPIQFSRLLEIAQTLWFPRSETYTMTRAPPRFSPGPCNLFPLSNGK